MLDAMRRGALNWVAKALLGLLVIAFALWGVPEFLRSFNRGYVAKVGNTEITAEEYREAYQDEMNAIARRFGRRLTPDQARLLNIENRTLSRLIGMAVIDTHAHDLNLALSDKEVAKIIREDPAFSGVDGKFSPERYRQALYQINYSEGRYIAIRHKEELREQLTQTIAASVTPPPTMVETMHRYRDETRVIQFIAPDFERLVKVAPPDDAKLKDYYEHNKQLFVVPELRKFSLVYITQDEAKARTPVSDEEVKAAYEQDKESFNIPEKRHIQQLSFKDRAAAEKAYAELSKAKDFKAAAEKLGFKESDYDLGPMTRKAMIDSKIADAAFALKKGELSQPIEGAFTTVLVRVTEIEPGKIRTFDDVKGEIRDRIAGERVSQELQKVRDAVDNDRDAGKPLNEIAEALKLPFKGDVEADRAGKTADGKPALDLKDVNAIVEGVFGATPGIDADTVELSDGGYAWINLLSVTPAKQKPYEDAKAAVEEKYLEAEKRREINAAAAKMAERLKQGETLAKIAAEVGTKVEKTGAITRTTVPQGLTANAVQQAFAVAKDGAAWAATADGKSRVVLQVVEVTAPPPATPEQADNLKASLSRSMQQDLLAEYVNGLQSRYGLSINEATLRQALGTGPGDVN
ncbi:MAG TPA: SurA N-terminal domain-containing protein [Hyphomicrobiaceae bacterium]|nr:SurA N-terminal domain-containing protein [Hyphomicrobiaceae bacterium]